MSAPSPFLFALLPFFVRFRLFSQKDEQKQSLSPRKSAAWAQGACRHIVELDAASHAEFICFTDVARMHTQSEFPCSLSQWWCICSHGACVHMLERTGRLTSTLLRVLSQQLLLRVQGWEVRGHYLLCAFAFISMDNLHSHMSLRHGDGPTREGRRRMVLLVKPATFLPRSKRIQEHSITHTDTHNNDSIQVLSAGKLDCGMMEHVGSGMWDLSSSRGKWQKLTPKVWESLILEKLNKNLSVCM